MKKFIAIMVLGALGHVSSTAATAIKIHTTFGSPTDNAFVLKVVNSVKTTGRLPVDVPSLSYVTPEHLMTKSNGQGAILWVIDAEAAPGTTVALAGITGVLESTDPENKFSRIVSFEGTSYSPTAPGIRADESEITSGPATQTAQRVVVGVWGKSFTINSSQDEQEVKDWFYAFSNWSTTAQVTAGGSTAILTLRKLPPALKASVVDGDFVVTAESNGDPRRYAVMTASTPVGPWDDVGVPIKSGEGLSFGTVTGTRFFRLVTP